MIVEDSDLPIYLVSNLNALKEIATYLPFTKKELMQFSGFGKSKAEKYGDDILDLVQNYCRRNDVKSNMAAKETNPKRERKEKSSEEKTPTNILSFNLFKEGKSIAEIAKERNMTMGTIEGHLASFIASKQINIDDLVSVEKQGLIKEAAKIHGKESFKMLKENLPEDISYGELRMVLTAEIE
jgi:ATP-dependent DNA helicase RecQ